MDLTIDEVSELLSSSPDTVEKLAQDGDIPSYKLNNTTRFFSREEIENWMVHRKKEPKMKSGSSFEANPCNGRGHFCFYRAIHHGGIYTDIEGSTKEEIIRNTCELAAEKMQFDPQLTAEILLDRESLMPTSFGNGFAIPHPREILSQRDEDAIIVVYPKTPLEYGALDNKPVHTLFFLFSSSDKSHLHLLAKIAHLISDETAQAFFREKPTKEALLDLIRAWEK